LCKRKQSLQIKEVRREEEGRKGEEKKVNISKGKWEIKNIIAKPRLPKLHSYFLGRLYFILMMEGYLEGSIGQ